MWIGTPKRTPKTNETSEKNCGEQQENNTKDTNRFGFAKIAGFRSLDNKPAHTLVCRVIHGSSMISNHKLEKFLLLVYKCVRCSPTRSDDKTTSLL